MNITDVDNKIINGAKDAGDNDIYAYSRKWEKSFFGDMKALGIEMPDQITRVTEFMGEINDFISTLIEKGYAYRTDDGSVYFDVQKYQEDGYVRSPAGRPKLTRLDLSEAGASRIQQRDVEPGCEPG